MINFTDGKVTLDGKNTLTASRNENLGALADKGLLETREYPGGIYYYGEQIEDNIRFGIFISLKNEKIDNIILRWLDGPCTSKDWDNVTEKALRAEYRRLLNFVEHRAGRPPDSRKERQCIWRFTWGQVNVSYESRDFITQIYMYPERD